MSVRLTLKPEVLELRTQLPDLKSIERPTADQKKQIARAQALSKLRKTITVPDHAVQGYIGDSGAYKIAPAETNDEQAQAMAAVAKAAVEEAMSEMQAPTADQIKGLIEETVKTAMADVPTAAAIAKVVDTKVKEAMDALTKG